MFVVRGTKSVLDIDAFEEEKVELSLTEMDALVTKMREAREKYDEKKRESTEAKNNLESIQRQVSSALESAGKDKYVCDAGTVSIIKTLAVRVPATSEDRQNFFEWLRANRGEEVANHYMSVNSQSLNSLYNLLTEEYAARGEVLQIDGLEQPTFREKLSFRKGK